MKTYHILLLVWSLNVFTSALNAQEQQVANPDKTIVNLIDKGLKAYDKADYNEAEIDFRKVLAKDPLNAVASYNLGLTETELDKNLEATRYFKKAGKQAADPLLKSKAYFNEGNVWYQKKKYDKAVEAYKNALRNNPSDEEARYNLALAQMKLKQQQKKNKNNKKNKQNKKDQNKQQNKNQQNKDQNKQDQKNKDQQKKNQQNKKDQNKQGQDKKDQKQNKKDQKNKDKNSKGDKKKDDQGKPKQDQKNKEGQDKKDQQKKNGSNGDKQQQQPKQGEDQKRKAKLTPQQVKQLLVALKNKENKTQKKVKARVLKGRGKKQKQDKDW